MQDDNTTTTYTPSPYIQDRIHRKLRAAGQTQTEKPWPEPLTVEALYGPAGDIVRAIEPHTEADPAAILLQFLVAYGNIIGHNAHWCVEDCRHSLNINVVLVGATSKARKGTSWARVAALFKPIDPGWPVQPGGLSSGEGLIYAVRDPSDDAEGEE